MMEVDQLFVHPLKSGRANELTKARVTNKGFEWDREFVIVDHRGVTITGREMPEILEIYSKIEGDRLFMARGADQIQKTLNTSSVRTVQQFGKPYLGEHVHSDLDRWLSDQLGQEVQLLRMGSQVREIESKYGGQEGDTVGFADASPVMILSNASLKNLNDRLESAVGIKNFRPNIVLEGCKSFEEDTWKRITVGECEFELVAPCRRCIFITIDPNDGTRHPNQEPLRTLASYRKDEQGVNFGVYAIPRKTGVISVGDKVAVIS